MKSFVFVLLSVFSIAYLSSCKSTGCTNPLAENYDESAKEESGNCTFPSADFRSYYDEKRNAAAQTFTVNNSDGATIIGDQGTVFYIPSDAFDNIQDVEITIIEVLTQADMIKLGLNTEGEDGLLISAGELYFKVTRAGTNEKVTLLKPITVNVPALGNSDPEMNVFDGTFDESGQMEWALDQSRSATISDSVPNSPSEEFYVLEIDDLDFEWLNLDKYRNDPNGREITVRLNEGHEITNTRAFVFLHNMKSVDQMTWVRGDDEYFLSSLPINEEATIVIYSRLNDQVYSYFNRITITEDITFTLALEQSTETAFNARVDQL